jgi:hypothetical protein
MFTFGHRKNERAAMPWRDVAETTIRLRKQIGRETLRDGAIDALTAAGISAQERGLPLERIVDHIEATYHDYTIEYVADEYPCDPWSCREVIARAA